MVRWKSFVICAALLAVGYVAGRCDLLVLTKAQAQLENPPSEDDEAKIFAVHRALRDAAEQLRQDNRYTTITEGVNPFLVLVGGGDAAADLASGNGVDPMTFAALYAGKVSPEFAEQMGTDEEGRVTYEGKPVQLYSKKRLVRAYAEIARILANDK
ncbi:MAG: hypothetical protein R3C01_00820 [Planctomycetaceae bacterium]